MVLMNVVEHGLRNEVILSGVDLVNLFAELSCADVVVEIGKEKQVGLAACGTVNAIEIGCVGGEGK